LEKKKPIRKNRFKKKPRQTRQKLVGRLLVGLKLMALVTVILGFSALFMVGYAAVTRIDYFRTEAIDVRGLSRLSDSTVLTQAKIQRGDNLLAINLALVRKRLLAHPWIAAVRVSREIPATISIDITEHKALAVLDLGRKFLINTGGRIFKEHGPDDPQNLPVVTGVAYADISLGNDELTPAMTAVVEVLQISRSGNGTVPYDQILEVSVDRKMGVALTAWDDRRRIKFGFGQFESKFKRVGQLLPHLKNNPQWQGFVTIDVNNPDRIVVQSGSPL
jgi:cell division protein FtsQ